MFDPLKAYNSETDVYRIELISKRARLVQVITSQRGHETPR